VEFTQFQLQVFLVGQLDLLMVVLTDLVIFLKAHKELLEYKVLQELLELMERKELKELLVLVLKEQLVLKGLLVSKAQLAHRELLEQLVL